MGGDEFCVVAPLRTLTADELGRLCAMVLSEDGDGFRIGCSYGAVALPAELTDASEALRTADERLYADKHTGRASAGTQTSAVLLSAVAARDPELGDHHRDVAALADAVARAVGLPAEER
jgi:GGDEF domain-containing protein